jgi:hypothetical protein
MRSTSRNVLGRRVSAEGDSMLNHNTQTDLGIGAREVDYVAGGKPEAHLADALRELYELLEEYGPRWYTKEHHEKAWSALESAKPL